MNEKKPLFERLEELERQAELAYPKPKSTNDGYWIRPLPTESKTPDTYA